MLSERKFLRIKFIHFEIQRSPVAKNATLGPKVGNRTCDPANLVHCSAYCATKGIFK